MGWWRRNRWGLVAVLPALLALLALSVEDFYYDVYKWTPLYPIPANADGWYSMQGTDLRLVDLSQATDLKTYDGDAFTPPANVVIWRAKVEFVVKEPKPQATDLPAPGPSASSDPGSDVAEPPETQIGGCEITMVDAAGRIFDDDPHDLLSGLDDAISRGCLASYDAPDPLHYVNTVYFALPRDAEPVAVRVNDFVSMPSYVRLTRG